MTQNELILQYLLTGCKMTALDGLKVAKTMNLRSRICELERQGYDIQKEWRTVTHAGQKKTVMAYYLKQSTR